MKLDAHAYLVEGGVEAIDAVLDMVGETVPNPRIDADVFYKAYGHFTIEDARSIRERAMLRGIGAHGRIFIIAAPTIPVDAQNTLLKTFEEPPAGARFFLIVPSPAMLLPTLRSRMQPLALAIARTDSPVDAALFLKTAPSARIEMLKPLLEKQHDDKRDLSGTVAFLSDMERTLGKNAAQNKEGLRAVYRARKYITDKGALAKSLLEQMALLVPAVSKMV